MSGVATINLRKYDKERNAEKFKVDFWNKVGNPKKLSKQQKADLKESLVESFLFQCNNGWPSRAWYALALNSQFVDAAKKDKVSIGDIL